LQKLRQANLVLFEPKVSYPLKLSLETLERDDVYELKKKVALRQKTGRKSSLPVAEKITEDQLLAETEDEIFINLEELRNGFVASGHNLYSFIMNYRYPREVSYDEKITIFCQMTSIYENEFDISEQFMKDGDVEYAIVKPG
jgi:hypothetical protein